MSPPPPAGPQGAPAPQLVGAMLLMALAAACTAVDAAIVRVVSADLHALEIALFRNLFSLIVFLPWLVRAGPGVLRTRHLPLHLIRAGLKLAALVAYFYALAVLPLADVTAIAFATPLFVALGAVLFLGEVLRFQRWGALVAGFVGVLVVLRPGSAVFDPRMLAAIGAAVALSGVALFLKYLAMREPANTIVGLNLLLSVPLALVLALPVWVTPDLPLFGWLALQGTLGAIAQLAATHAMSRADVSLLMPIEFLRLPLVALLGWLAFAEAVDVWTWVGGALIFASTVYLTRREAAASRRSLPAPSAEP